ncbi:MAG TPA: hypothetical protein PKI20_13280 [Verrucomicrobiota bacterium]|nr:hypothetical protein [Verrucomicrobiota bacterium]OQC26010.1 MAG: hypothetical protein BWX68_01082 [Verrucomicrobia bacterium ADurb.Bin063]HOC56588.1 hypothetical protein [Verrucomicrobiota bacterium]
MRIKTGSGNFQPCPEYNGSAVCVDVTPLKTVQTQFGPKDKFRFVYETGQTKDDGTPWCVWSAPFTPSYHENSALRPFLRKWLGRELTAEELKTFDTEDMLGKTAHITVIHEHSDGEVYANIALIQPDKSAEPLKPSGKFVRMKDRPPKDGNGYRRAEQASGGNGDLGATKIHVGKCKGLEVRDLSPEQVGALIGHWLPAAKANAKPSADDRRLIAALEAWQAAQKPVEDDNVPY